MRRGQVQDGVYTSQASNGNDGLLTSANHLHHMGTDTGENKETQPPTDHPIAGTKTKGKKKRRGGVKETPPEISQSSLLVPPELRGVDTELKSAKPTSSIRIKTVDIDAKKSDDKIEKSCRKIIRYFFTRRYWEDLVEVRNLKPEQRDCFRKLARSGKYDLKAKSRGTEPERVVMLWRRGCEGAETYAKSARAGDTPKPSLSHTPDKAHSTMSPKTPLSKTKKAKKPSFQNPEPLEISMGLDDEDGFQLSSIQRDRLRIFFKTYPGNKSRVESMAAKANSAPSKKSKSRSSRNEAQFQALVPPYPRIKKSQAIRDLPASKRRETLIKAVYGKQVTLVSGETGCGKTTQVPQFLLEEAKSRNESVCIVVTQPRRLPAISVARRVAEERGEKLGHTVGFHIRFERVASTRTALTFVTTGILLRVLSEPENLRQITHIVMDEIHERELFADYILGFLKQKLAEFPNLRLILMSATMGDQIRLFREYFSQPALVHIPCRTFEVTEYFLDDVLLCTDPKAAKAAGVGASTMEELNERVEELSGRFGALRTGSPDCLPLNDPHAVSVPNLLAYDSPHLPAIPAPGDKQMREQFVREYWKKRRVSNGKVRAEDVDGLLIAKLIAHLLPQVGDSCILVFLPGMEEISMVKTEVEARVSGSQLLLLTLHSQLYDDTVSAQLFGPTPSGMTKVVLSTNIAEASVTIPDVVVVIDSGRVKGTVYWRANESSVLTESWVAASSATQRAGRAGRTRHGAVYRLFSRSQFAAFRPSTEPEIHRVPLTEACLRARLMMSKDVGIADFFASLPEPPPARSVNDAIAHLKELEAIDEEEGLTGLGKWMLALPVTPRQAVMLLHGLLLACIEPVLTIVSVLAHGDPFLSPYNPNLEAKRRERVKSVKEHMSDHYLLYQAVKAFEEAGDDIEARYDVAAKWDLRYSAMLTILNVKTQLRRDLKQLKCLGKKEKSWESLNRNSESWVLVKAAMAAGGFPFLGLVKSEEDGLRTRCVPNARVYPHSALAAHPYADLRLTHAYMTYEEHSSRRAASKPCLRILTLLSSVSVAVLAGPAKGTLRPIKGRTNASLRPKKTKKQECKNDVDDGTTGQMDKKEEASKNEKEEAVVDEMDKKEDETTTTEYPDTEKKDSEEKNTTESDEEAEKKAESESGKSTKEDKGFQRLDLDGIRMVLSWNDAKLVHQLRGRWRALIRRHLAHPNQVDKEERDLVHILHRLLADFDVAAAIPAPEEFPLRPGPTNNLKAVAQLKAPTTSQLPSSSSPHSKATGKAKGKAKKGTS